MTATTSMPTEIQTARATEIMTSLATDGRFSGKLWTAGDKVRVYVEDFGYLAIGRDGTVYPSLRRYVGNITRAAGL